MISCLTISTKTQLDSNPILGHSSLTPHPQHPPPTTPNPKPKGTRLKAGTAQWKGSFTRGCQ